jgi:hypothetical protein
MWDFFFFVLEGHILSSTAGDGCSKRIKLLRDQGWGSKGEGGAGRGTNKRPNFYYKKPWCEKFSS